MTNHLYTFYLEPPQQNELPSAQEQALSAFADDMMWAMSQPCEPGLTVMQRLLIEHPEIKRTLRSLIRH